MTNEIKIGVVVTTCLMTIFWGYDYLKPNGVVENDDKVVFDDKLEQQVVERKVVVKNVYVNEDDFSSYSSDATGSSYWYVYFENKVVRGYDVIEIDVPYPDIGKILHAVRVENKIEYDEFTSINFMQRVTFESYKAFQLDSDGVGV